MSAALVLSSLHKLGPVGCFSRRSPENEGVVCNDTAGVMDWKKFDTDGEYAWRHLEKCLAICTDVIKKQNAEIKRVTFVEYAVTDFQILIWVLHSHGTEEPRVAHTPSTLPSMFSVDVKEVFTQMVAEGHPDIKEYFEKLWGPQKLTSKYNAFLLESQTIEATILFEDKIEKLRSDPEPKRRSLILLYELLVKPIDISGNLVDGEPLIFIPDEVFNVKPIIQ